MSSNPDFFHSTEFPITGTYVSADIYLNFTASDMKTVLQNMPNVAEVSVSKSQPNSITTVWTVTFLSEVADVPLLNPYSSTFICGSQPSKKPDVAYSQHFSFPGQSSYGWQVVSNTPGSPNSNMYMIQHLQPGQQYFVRVAAANDLGFGAKRSAAPSGINVPITPPTMPTQLEGNWSAPKIFVSSESSVLIKVGSPDFDGGALTSNFVVEWDLKSTFDSGYSGQAFGIASVPAYSVLCQRCVSAIDYGYNLATPTVRISYKGTKDSFLQLQTGVRVVIVTTDDMQPYTFVVANQPPSSNTTEFFVQNQGLRSLTFSNKGITSADLYLSGATYEINGLIPGAQYFVRVRAENAAGRCDPSMAFIADCGAATLTSPSSVIPRGPPPAAEGLVATVLGANSVQLNWTAPVSIGPLVSYRVDVFTRSIQASLAESSFYGDNEVQVLSSAGNINDGGYFTVAYGTFSIQLPGLVSGPDAGFVFNTSVDISYLVEPGDKLFVDGAVYTVAAWKYRTNAQIHV